MIVAAVLLVACTDGTTSNPVGTAGTGETARASMAAADAASAGRAAWEQALKAGTTCRFGAFFADPGASTVAVDLQQAGVALRVPIESGFPRANLISTQRAGTSAWNPAAVTVGSLVTAPVPAMTGHCGPIGISWWPRSPEAASTTVRV